MTWRVGRIQGAGRGPTMHGPMAVLVLALLLPTTATADPAPATPGALGNGSFGAIGVVVDDGLGYGDGASAARTPAYVVQALMSSGYFTSAALNRFERPQQLRVKIRRKPSGSEDAAAGKAIVGAATLFLLPMKQSYDYAVEFEVECRGRLMGEWKHLRTLEQTQFLLADPSGGTRGLIEEAVSQFVRQASESGKLAAGCT